MGKIPVAYIAETDDGRQIYWKGYFGEWEFMHPWKDAAGHRFPLGVRIRGGIKKIYLTRKCF